MALLLERSCFNEFVYLKLKLRHPLLGTLAMLRIILSKLQNNQTNQKLCVGGGGLRGICMAHVKCFKVLGISEVVKTTALYTIAQEDICILIFTLCFAREESSQPRRTQSLVIKSRAFVYW